MVEPVQTHKEACYDCDGLRKFLKVTFLFYFSENFLGNRHMEPINKNKPTTHTKRYKGADLTISKVKPNSEAQEYILVSVHDSMAFFSYEPTPTPLFLTSSSRIIPHLANNILFLKYNSKLGVNPFVIYSTDKKFLFGYLEVCNGSFKVEYEESDPIDQTSDTNNYRDRDTSYIISSLHLADGEILAFHSDHTFTHFKYNPIDKYSTLRNVKLPKGELTSILKTNTKHTVCVIIKKEKTKQDLLYQRTEDGGMREFYMFYYTFYFINVITGKLHNFLNTNNEKINKFKQLTVIEHPIVCVIQEKENLHDLTLIVGSRIYKTSFESIINKERGNLIDNIKQNEIQLIPNNKEMKQYLLTDGFFKLLNTHSLIRIKENEYILMNQRGYIFYLQLENVKKLEFLGKVTEFEQLFISYTFELYRDSATLTLLLHSLTRNYSLTFKLDLNDVKNVSKWETKRVPCALHSTKMEYIKEIDKTFVAAGNQIYQLNKIVIINTNNTQKNDNYSYKDYFWNCIYEKKVKNKLGITYKELHCNATNDDIKIKHKNTGNFVLTTEKGKELEITLRIKDRINYSFFNLADVVILKNTIVVVEGYLSFYKGEIDLNKEKQIINLEPLKQNWREWEGSSNILKAKFIKFSDSEILCVFVTRVNIKTVLIIKEEIINKQTFLLHNNKPEEFNKSKGIEISKLKDKIVKIVCFGIVYLVFVDEKNKIKLREIEEATLGQGNENDILKVEELEQIVLVTGVADITFCYCSHMNALIYYNEGFVAKYFEGKVYETCLEYDYKNKQTLKLIKCNMSSNKHIIAGKMGNSIYEDGFYYLAHDKSTFLMVSTCFEDSQMIVYTKEIKFDRKYDYKLPLSKEMAPLLEILDLPEIDEIFHILRIGKNLPLD
eukprot:GAHX01002089.1.p1 GENE.GAHX01002089.1~~GAHX01002089.1.p1  ORF type:complete len:889 (+),score=190.19 GAHX01002089.1:322-2988(+)